MSRKLMVMLAGVFWMILFILGSVARAEVKIQELNISAWPEYDDPRVLVLYYGTFPYEQELPTTVELLVPMGADLGMACSITDKGEHRMAVSQKKPYDDNFIVVSFSVTEPHFHLEYYIDAIKKDGAKKSFSIPFKTLMPIGMLELEVQEPAGAKNFTFADSSVHTGSDGLRYYTKVVGPFTPQDEVAIEVSYEKESDVLSVATLGQKGGGGTATPAGTAPPEAPAPSSMTNLVIAVIFGFIIAVIVFTVLGGLKPRGEYAQARQEASTKPRRAEPNMERARRHPAQTKKRVSISAKAEHGQARYPKFCSNCGQRLEKGDKFCSQCGQPIKHKQ